MAAPVLHWDRLFGAYPTLAAATDDELRACYTSALVASADIEIETGDKYDERIVDAEAVAFTISNELDRRADLSNHARFREAAEYGRPVSTYQEADDYGL